MPGNVQFRRIHGRVVPVHAAMNKDERLRGVGHIAVGTAVVIGSGIKSAVDDRNAAYAFNAAKNYKAARAFNIASKVSKEGRPLHKLTRAAAQYKVLAAKNILQSRRFSASAARFKTFGIVAGSALLASGIHKLLPEKAKKHPKTAKAVSAGTGIGAAFGIRSAYYKVIQPVLTHDWVTHGPGVPMSTLWQHMKLAAKRVSVRGVKF